MPVVDPELVVVPLELPVVPEVPLELLVPPEVVVGVVVVPVVPVVAGEVGVLAVSAADPACQPTTMIAREAKMLPSAARVLTSRTFLRGSDGRGCPWP